MTPANSSQKHFPFTAVTGQTEFKQALILNAINPNIGGILISGPRGSAKSTLARALAELLPDNGAFITLPLGASEEMVIGTLDLQHALHEQQVVFNEGLLAKAHQGVLYVDEVNLLPDALVDVLLDVSVSKQNIIERDGISHQHAADFILIGTMNPDEGELRPQLTDRFGLCVQLDNQYSIDERVAIVQLREAFDRDPAVFCQQYATQQQHLLKQLQQARQQLPQVQCPPHLQRLIAERCSAAQVEGMRADLVWYRAALAEAAWQERNHVSEVDIDTVEALVLAHRRQIDESTQTSSPPSTPPPFSRPPKSQSTHQQGQWGSMPPQQQHSESMGLQLDKDQIMFPGTLKRSPNPLSASSHPGDSVGQQTASQAGSQRINWFATLSKNTRNHAQPHDWQWHYRKQRKGSSVFHLILLDSSASVLAQKAFGKAKGIILQLARQAYLAREQLSILGFGNQQVNTLLPRIRAPKQIKQLLEQLTAGGGTPLHAALQQAQQQIKRLQHQQPDLKIYTYILTDSRVASLPPAMTLGRRCWLIDTEQAQVKRGRGEVLAQRLGAEYLPIHGMPSTRAPGSTSS